MVNNVMFGTRYQAPAAMHGPLMVRCFEGKKLIFEYQTSDKNDAQDTARDWRAMGSGARATVKSVR